MKRILIFLIAVFVSFAAAYGQQKVSFMPCWTPQAQFAGYYVAFEKGYFKDEGLDVEIKNLKIGMSKSSIECLKDGEVDICSSQLLNSLIERGRGADLVNLLQLSQNSGLMLVSHTPLNSYQDLNGMKIGRWTTAYYEIAMLFCNEFKLNVQWIPFLQNINLYVSGAIDATLCFSFSEYLGLLFSMGSIPDEQTLRFADYGFNWPEDAVITTSDYYENNPEIIEKFKNATKKGWDYARTHKSETVEIVMKYLKDNNIASNRTFQSFMLDEILKLQVNSKTGKADYQKVDEETFNKINESIASLYPDYQPVVYKEFIK